MKRLLVGILLFSVTTVWAQQRLVVNGQSVEGLTTSLVPGSSYAPARALADALGAEMVYDAAGNTLTLDLAGTFLTLGVYDSPQAAPPEGAAVLKNGERVAGGGAVLDNGLVYVPVKPVATAFDSAVSYLADQQTVMVVSPRVRLEQARLESQGDGERFILDFSGSTSFEPTFNAALGTLQVRFDRTGANPQQFAGRTFSRAALVPNAGYLDFRATLLPGYSYQTFTSPNEGGFSFVVDIVPQRENEETNVVVIDPGHGGQDPGMILTEGNEAGLSLRFAQTLAEALSDQGLESRLTREEGATLGASLRSQQGIGVDLFLSLHAADLLPGQYNLYYLGEAADPATLDAAVRENARAALESGDTDSLRRRVLLNLVPDLSLGETYSRTLERDLLAAGYRANRLQSAPLAVLDGAAGRGLLLELSPADLRDDALAQRLAESIAALLEKESSD